MVGDRARAARLGPVRPETRKGKKGKDRPLEGSGWRSDRAKGQGPGRHAGPVEGVYPRGYRSRVAGSSGDRELRHFLEKSLLGGACAICTHACALRL